MLFETLKLIFKSSNVKRYHIHPVIGEQNIAHHSWRLVMLLYYIVGNPSGNLIKAALLHDVPEVVTGDTPYTAKKLSIDLKRALDQMEQAFLSNNDLEIILFDNEKSILKMCDMLELIWFCREQIDLGNANFTSMFDRGMNIAKKLIREDEGLASYNSKILSILEQISIPGGTLYEY